MELSEAEKAIVSQNIEGIPVPVPLDTRGLVPIELFCKIQGVLTKNSYDLRQASEKAHVKRRRDLLSADKMEQYEKEIAERQLEIRAKTVGMTKFTLKEIDLSEQTYPMCMQYIQQNPALKAQLEQSQQGVLKQIEESLIFADEKPVLSKEVVM